MWWGAQGVEATLFATLMSIGNASAGASATLGSALTALLGVTSTNFGPLPLLVTLCTLTRLVPPLPHCLQAIIASLSRP